jgi:polyisoprenoid-binding protein YceI
MDEVLNRTRVIRVVARAGWTAFLLAGTGPPVRAQDATTYVLSADSRFEVAIAKSGLFSFVGHNHVIRARGVRGRVVYDRVAPTRSQVDILVPAESLQVLTPPDTAEIRKVTEAMRSDVLDVAHHPEIRFVSRSVEPIPGGFRVRGDLVLVGTAREVSVDVHVVAGPDTLLAAGSFAVDQSSFGIRPYHGGPGGLVRVADRVTFSFAAVALRTPAP